MGRTLARGPRLLRRELPVALGVLLGLGLFSCAPDTETPLQDADVFRSGSSYTRQIALTFDDGPHPGSTQRILDVLGKADVRATFFCCGQMVDRHPELARAIVAAGHSVGNHTYHHQRLDGLAETRIGSELERGAAAIASATGVRPRLFRPPGGRRDHRVTEVAGGLGQTMVLWSLSSRDCDPQTRDYIRTRLVRRAHSGAVVLLHDGPEETIAALPGAISELRAQGYSFVTVDEMIGGR